ncbi:DUF1097 domain-containing protein [Bengtsoniella intestinalis]|uniref:DUF1097 domain-containing protein n=1 Tax=Bengtsoniella intestinalis TaxID=3073143 RepID=UPI00391F1FA0
MTLKKYFPIAVFIGVQAAALQALDQAICAGFVISAGGGWIAFQAWAMYFLAGCNIKGGIKALIGYVLGMVASIAIFMLGGNLGALGFWCMPVTLVILVPIILYLDQAPDYFNMVPAVFVGAGAFFGIMSYVPGAAYGSAFTGELVYCILGLICGWMTVTFRGWYEGKYVN